MLELQNATRGGAEVLLLLTVPGDEQSIMCGINLTSTQTALPGEPRALRLVVSGTTAQAACSEMHLHTRKECAEGRTMGRDGA